MSFFKPMSEYFEFILEKEIPRYKLSSDPTDISKG
jgi:hypothetical protein